MTCKTFIFKIIFYIKSQQNIIKDIFLFHPRQFIMIGKQLGIDVRNIPMKKTSWWLFVLIITDAYRMENQKDIAVFLLIYHYYISLICIKKSLFILPLTFFCNIFSKKITHSSLQLQLPSNYKCNTFSRIDMASVELRYYHFIFLQLPLFRPF